MDKHIGFVMAEMAEAQTRTPKPLRGPAQAAGNEAAWVVLAIFIYHTIAPWMPHEPGWLLSVATAAIIGAIAGGFNYWMWRDYNKEFNRHFEKLKQERKGAQDA